MFLAEPSKTGLQMPSSARTLAARTILTDSPSGKTIRLGFASCFVENAVHDAPGTRQSGLELTNVVFPGRVGFAGDAGFDRCLGDGGRLPQQHPVVEGLGNQVFAAEFERLAAVGPDHRVGDVLLGEIGQGPGGRQLHLLVDVGGGHVERTAEDEGEAEHVVDLVGVVRSTCRHDDVRTHREGVLRRGSRDPGWPWRR